MLNTTILPHPNIIHYGDFNIHTYNCNADHKRLTDILSTFQLDKNIVKWPTRVTDRSYSIIDVFINLSQETTCAIFDNVISDHRTIAQLSLQANGSSNSSYYYNMRHDDDSINQFKWRLAVQNWNELNGITDNVNAADIYNIFSHHFKINFSLLRYVVVCTFYS